MATFLSLKFLKSFTNSLPHLRWRSRTHKIPQYCVDRMVNTFGLPGDKPSDMPHVLSVLSEALNDAQICWFVAGDRLLNHYHVAKVTFDLEFIVRPEDMTAAQKVFSTLSPFCLPFSAPQSNYSHHLAQYPRFKVNGMNQFISLAPATVYGLNGLTPESLIYTSEVPFPLIPLPLYVRGMATVAARERWLHGNFACQLEFLIDGVDIDEEWCDKFLADLKSEHTWLLERSTRQGKKQRMGSHPKYEGRITTFINNDEERKSARAVVGRDWGIAEVLLAAQSCGKTIE